MKLFASTLTGSHARAGRHQRVGSDRRRRRSIHDAQAARGFQGARRSVRRASQEGRRHGAAAQEDRRAGGNQGRAADAWSNGSARRGPARNRATSSRRRSPALFRRLLRPESKENGHERAIEGRQAGARCRSRSTGRIPTSSRSRPCRPNVLASAAAAAEGHRLPVRRQAPDSARRAREPDHRLHPERHSMTRRRSAMHRASPFPRSLVPLALRRSPAWARCRAGQSRCPTSPTR